MKIKNIYAYEILDSRGNPTIQAEVILENNLCAKASVPSGASTGSKEALELRDGDAKHFEGKGVLTACQNITQKILPAIKDIDVVLQEKIDKTMLALDGTPNKSNLGANAILAVSLAVAKVSALEQGLSLWQYLRKLYKIKTISNWSFPVPMMNVINGGAHSDSGLDIQEFMVVPSGIKGFAQRVYAGAEIYQGLKKLLQESNYRIAVGDEGGFAPNVSANHEALDFLIKAIQSSRYELGAQIKTGLDVAASEFYDAESQRYNLKLDGISLDSNQLGAMYRDWKNKYHLELIEDPMSEFDWDGWTNFNQAEGSALTIIGDDLTTTNKNTVEEAHERKAINAVLIKVNQIGSLTETMKCIQTARKFNMKIAVSHRSGETTDDFIADLAVAVQADYVKFGAPARGERVCKYNRIIEIEREARK